MAQAHPRTQIPRQLPVLPLRSTIVYPTGVIGVQVGMTSSLEMLSAHPETPLIVALVVAPGGPDDPIDAKALTRKIAIAARLSDRLNLPGGTVQATVQGIQRMRLTRVEETGGYFTARVDAVKEIPAPEPAAEELITRIITDLDALASEVDRVPKEVPRILRMNVADPGRFADLVASLANFSVAAKEEVLRRLDIEDRLNFVHGELQGQIQRVRKIDGQQQEQEQEQEGKQLTPAEKAEKLRDRIKRLQSELGEVDPIEREAIDYLRRIETADMPARVAAEARSEVERLRALTTTSSEAAEIRTFLDWLLHMPWRRRTTGDPSEIDLKQVKRELDAELLGLDEPKNRLLDYLAVAKLRGDLRGPIPCIVGPPDVGKTSLVNALARGLGRPVAKLELGNRGEAQLLGTRRTRSGAQPGKLAESLRDVGVRDPVFVLAEMDEIGLGKVEGDPIEAMEDVLSWEGREDFTDRYLGLPFDLSDALFVATAQDFFRVPRDLRELLVEIRLAGYTPEEKVEIVRDKLLDRLIAEHGLRNGDVSFSDDVLAYLARGYARDAGLGQMRRALSTLLRTRARAKAQGDVKRWEFTPEKVEEILGLPRYVATPAESAPEIGVVTGLAWTAAGGELMFIEALKMPGSGRLIITGMLGDVMRESVNAAYSWVRSRGEQLGIPEEAFKDHDIHVHFPVGAIPKDGPSAGIAVTLAIASTLSNRPVRHDIAMTGEVTLRGKVLEIGGVKEKVLAAYRAGIRDIVLPSGNDRDLREVPDDVRASITFEFVERMDQVLGLALLEPIAGEGEGLAIQSLPRTTEADEPRKEEVEPRAAAAGKRRGARKGGA